MTAALFYVVGVVAFVIVTAMLVYALRGLKR